MANFYQLNWAMTGFPDAFIILRWQEQTNSWFVINNVDGAALEPFSFLLIRNKSTLNQVGGNWTLYNGLHWPAIGSPLDQSFEDYHAINQWGTYYQIIQYYQSNPGFSAYTTANPTTDSIWNTQTSSDHLVKIKKKYYGGVLRVRSVNIQDADTNQVGRLKIESSFTGKSYQAAMGTPPELCGKSEMLEVIGSDIKINRNVWVRDIARNVLEWT